MRAMQVFKNIGVVAGTIIATATILAWISSHAWAAAIHPLLEAQRQEASIRAQTDSLIVLRLENLSRDRVDLIDILATEPGPARQAVIASVKRRWTRNEP